MASKAPKSGAVIDQAREVLHQVVAELEGAVTALTAMGCINGHIHTKTGAKAGVKYIREAADASGKRRFIYIGKDPERLREAEAKIERFQRRERLQRELRRLRFSVTEFEAQVEDVFREADLLVKGAQDLVREKITAEVREAMTAGTRRKAAKPAKEGSKKSAPKAGATKGEKKAAKSAQKPSARAAVPSVLRGAHDGRERGRAAPAAR